MDPEQDIFPSPQFKDTPCSCFTKEKNNQILTSFTFFKPTNVRYARYLRTCHLAKNQKQTLHLSDLYFTLTPSQAKRVLFAPLQDFFETNAMKNIKILQVDHTERTDGVTSLIYASHRGDARLVKNMISLGANVNKQAQNGNSVLMETVYGETGADNRKAVAELLIRAGARINLPNKDGHTALTVAAQRGDLTLLRLFFRLGHPNVNHKTKLGSTALTLAISEKQMNTVIFLIDQCDADIMTEDKAGLTPLCWAQVLHPPFAGYLSLQLGLQGKLKEFIKRRLCVITSDSAHDSSLFHVVYHLSILLLMMKPSRALLVSGGGLSTIYNHKAWDRTHPDEDMEGEKAFLKVLPWIVALSCGMLYDEAHALSNFIQNGVGDKFLENLNDVLPEAEEDDKLVVQSMLVPIVSTFRGRSWLCEKGIQLPNLCKHLADTSDTVPNMNEDICRAFAGIMEGQFSGYKLKEMCAYFKDVDIKSFCPDPPKPVRERLASMMHHFEEIKKKARACIADQNMQALVEEEDTEKGRKDIKRETKRKKRKEKAKATMKEATIVKEAQPKEEKTVEAKIEQISMKQNKIPVKKEECKPVPNIEEKKITLPNAGDAPRYGKNVTVVAGRDPDYDLAVKLSLVTDSDTTAVDHEFENKVENKRQRRKANKLAANKAKQIVVDVPKTRFGKRPLKKEVKPTEHTFTEKQPNLDSPESWPVIGRVAEEKEITVKTVWTKPLPSKPQPKETARVHAQHDIKFMYNNPSQKVGKQYKSGSKNISVSNRLNKDDQSKPALVMDKKIPDKDHQAISKLQNLSIENNADTVNSFNVIPEVPKSDFIQPVAGEQIVDQPTNAELNVLYMPSVHNPSTFNIIPGVTMPALPQNAPVAHLERDLDIGSRPSQQEIAEQSNQSQAMLDAKSTQEASNIATDSLDGSSKHSRNDVRILGKQDDHRTGNEAGLSELPATTHLSEIDWDTSIESTSDSTGSISLLPQNVPQQHPPIAHVTPVAMGTEKIINDIARSDKKPWEYDGFEQLFFRSSFLPSKLPLKPPPGLSNVAQAQILEPKQTIPWIPRSKRWQPLLKTLINLPEKERQKIGSLHFCFTMSDLIIAKGSNGTMVTLGVRDDGTEVAVKRMLRHNSRFTRNELMRLRLPQLEHENIVKYKDFAEDAHFSYLALELCERTLEEHIYQLKQSGQLASHARGLVRQLLRGLAVLHASKILHMDLKPKNVLVDVRGNLRLADFGLSRQMAEDQSTIYDAANQGTRCWRPKEALLLNGSPQAYKDVSDIQVAGMMVHYIITGGHHPYGDDPMTCEENIRSDRPRLSHVKDDVMLHLLFWMLHPDMRQRQGAAQCLTHPFFWTEERRFMFLERVGNEPEISSRAPCPIRDMINSSMEWIGYHNWTVQIPQAVMTATKRCYSNCVADLLRFMGHIDMIFHQMSPKLQAQMGSDPCRYMLDTFPRLFMAVYDIVQTSEWRQRRCLREFFSTSTEGTSDF